MKKEEFNYHIDNYEDIPFFYWEEVVLWLSQFMDKYSFFSDGEWLSNHNELAYWDINKIMNFNLLFDKVKSYALDNYVFPYKDKDLESYFILWNDIFYEVGKNREYYYCKRMKEGFKLERYIDFEDVISGKKQQSAKFIDQKLQILADLIKVYTMDGVPEYAIYNTMVQAIFKGKEERNSNIIDYRKIKKKSREG